MSVQEATHCKIKQKNGPFIVGLVDVSPWCINETYTNLLSELQLFEGVCCVRSIQTKILKLKA